MGLFNQIRKSLIKNGNVGNYLFYAIGEILIVIIGIFLAIQFNNWNENRKTDKAIENVFLEIQNNLENNSQASESFSK